MTVTDVIKLINDIEYYETGFGGAINPNNGLITLHKQDDLVLQEHQLIKEYIEEVVDKNTTKLRKAYSDERDEELVFVMSPISLGDDTWIMYTAAPVNEVLRSANSLLFVGIISCLIAFTIIVIIILSITRNTEKILTRITNYSSSISKGDFSISMEERDLQLKDEFGILANAFAKVIENIKALNEEVKHLTTSAINGRLDKRGRQMIFKVDTKK